MDETLKVKDIVFIYLQNGWSWGPSDNPKYMSLKKDGFSFYVNPFELSVEKLLQMIEAYGVYRGKNERE